MTCTTEFRDGGWRIMGHGFYGDKCTSCGLPTEDFEYLTRDVRVFCDVNLTTGEVTFPVDKE